MSRQVPATAPADLFLAVREELARVRTEVRPAYEECGASAAFALRSMQRDLEAGDAALASQDHSALIAAWRRLYTWET